VEDKKLANIIGRIIEKIFTPEQMRSIAKKLSSWQRNPNEKLFIAQIGEQSYKELLSGDMAQSLKSFAKLLEQIDLKGAEEIWWNSYDQLVRYVTCKELTAEEKMILKDINCEHQPVNKIFVSGMGWSGSGALYDFFREFKSVSPINPEFRHVEGNSSLKSILSKLEKGERKQFREELAKFFWITLLGYANPKKNDEITSGKYAKKFFIKNYPIEYAMTVNYFVKNIIIQDRNNTLSVNGLEKISSEFIDLMVEPFLLKSAGHQFVLLNNIIHIFNIALTRSMNNFSILCVFRDPRSNYVAHALEDKKFYKRFNSEDANITSSFIKRYRKRRKKYNSDILSLEKQSSFIHTTQKLFNDLIDPNLL